MGVRRRRLIWLLLPVVAVLSGLATYFVTTTYFARSAMETAYQQQVQRDKYLEQGYRLDSQGQQVPYSVVEWRTHYDDAQARMAAQYWASLYSRLRFKGKAMTEEQKALQGYYEVAGKFTDLASGITDVGAREQALDTYVNGLSPKLAHYVEENTHPNTPMVEEYLNVKRQMQPYWQIQDKWLDNPETKVDGKTMRRWRDEAYRLENEGRLVANTDEGQKMLLASKAIMSSNLMWDTLNAAKDEKLYWRAEHPDVEALMIKWGYVTTPAAQQLAPKPVRLRR